MASRKRPPTASGKELSESQRPKLLDALKTRFEKNMSRHPGMKCADVQARLEAGADKLGSLNEIERTGGEIQGRTKRGLRGGSRVGTGSSGR